MLEKSFETHSRSSLIGAIVADVEVPQRVRLDLSAIRGQRKTSLMLIVAFGKLMEGHEIAVKFSTVPLRRAVPHQLLQLTIHAYTTVLRVGRIALTKVTFETALKGL